MRLRPLLVILVMLTMPLMARAKEKSAGDEVAHGTINVVLANQNGIVALTDSMITAGSHQLREPGQKLFKLDDRTVCTIAGFVGADGPIPDLYTSTSAIIHDYTKQLAQHPEQGIREKLTSLAYLFKFRLTAIATLRDAAGLRTPADSYAFELTIAGYDSDGVPRIGQITLWTVPSGDLLESEIEDASVTEIGKQLVRRVAGQPAIANRLLDHPDSVKGDPVLSTYASSLRKDRGESLTIEQMKKIASRLAWYTAQSCKSVGGADQIAILQAGHVVNIEQAAFPEPREAFVRFNMSTNDTYLGRNAVEFAPETTMLFLRSTFVNSQRQLDGNYFFSDTFVNSVLTYDGGPVYFDKTNQITNCALLLGPHVKRDDKTVRHLISDFHWVPYSYRPMAPPAPQPPRP